MSSLPLVYGDHDYVDIQYILTFRTAATLIMERNGKCKLLFESIITVGLI